MFAFSAPFRFGLRGSDEFGLWSSRWRENATYSAAACTGSERGSEHNNTNGFSDDTHICAPTNEIRLLSASNRAGEILALFKALVYLIGRCWAALPPEVPRPPSIQPR